MSYLALKHLHVTCVVLSGLGFALRGWWMINDSPWLKARLAKVVPKGLWALLLGGAWVVAWQGGQSRSVQGGRTARVFGLLAYIVCGTIALKRGRTMRQRTLFLAFAVLAYAYIVSVALTRNPLVWL